MPGVFKDKPLSEITLRKFEKPRGLEKEELIRKFCISLGLLQPGDSRDIIVDVLRLLIEKGKERKTMNSKEIIEELKKLNKKGNSEPNIRRQISRLEKIGLIEKINKAYRIREFLPLKEIFKEYIFKMNIEPTIKRIEEYCEEIDRL